MPDPRVILLQEKLTKLSEILTDPTPLYKEHILKDDEKTVKPNLKAKHVSEFTDDMERRSKSIEILKAEIESESLEVPFETVQTFNNVIKDKEVFLEKGSTNWDKSQSFSSPSFYIANNTLFFQYKDTSPIDYIEIVEISPDGKSTTSSQGGTIGDNEFIKVPVIIDYLEKNSPGTKYIVTVVNGSGQKGFFTYVYK